MKPSNELSYVISNIYNWFCKVLQFLRNAIIFVQYYNRHLHIPQYRKCYLFECFLINCQSMTVHTFLPLPAPQLY